MTPTIYPYEQEPEGEDDEILDPALPDDDFEELPGFLDRSPIAAESREDLPSERPAASRIVSYRGSTNDPLFGFLIGLAISIGLTPLLPANADLRYSLAWGALAAVSVIAWLLGSAERIGQETPENIAWGAVFGAILGAPTLLFGYDVLNRAAHILFADMRAGTLLAFLVFVMPLAETLFFRGLIQRQMAFYMVGLLATFWSLVLFFPVMWGDFIQAPAVGLVIGVALLMMNLLYSYVRERNGLAAAWICQIVANLLLVFVPFL